MGKTWVLEWREGRRKLGMRAKEEIWINKDLISYHNEFLARGLS